METETKPEIQRWTTLIFTLAGFGFAAGAATVFFPLYSSVLKVLGWIFWAGCMAAVVGQIIAFFHSIPK